MSTRPMWTSPLDAFHRPSRVRAGTRRLPQAGANPCLSSPGSSSADRRIHRQQDRQQHRPGLIVDIALGIVGAVVGGFLFHQFGEPGVSGLNLYSLLVATVGAVVVLWLYHALVGRRVV